MGQGLLIIMASRSRLDTPHSVGLLLTSDRPVAETSLTDTTRHDTTQHLQETAVHSPGGIRTRNNSKWAAAEPRLRLGGSWNRLKLHVLCNKIEHNLYNNEIYRIFTRRQIINPVAKQLSKRTSRARAHAHASTHTHTQIPRNHYRQQNELQRAYYLHNTEVHYANTHISKISETKLGT